MGNSLEEMAALVGEACIKLQQANIAHNLLICDGGSRVFLFPQCYAEKQARGLVSEELLDTGVNPACWEIAGECALPHGRRLACCSKLLPICLQPAGPLMLAPGPLHVPVWELHVCVCGGGAGKQLRCTCELLTACCPCHLWSACTGRL